MVLLMIFLEDESWLVDDLLDAKRRSKAFTVRLAMSLVLFCCHASLHAILQLFFFGVIKLNLYPIELIS